MKRLIGMLLALTLLCGCGAKAPTVPEKDPEPIPPVVRPVKPAQKPIVSPEPVPLPPDEPAPAPAPTPVPPPTPAPEPADPHGPQREPITDPDPEPEPEPALAPYYIRVNCEMNTITVYTLNENRAYTVPYCAMVCSCGGDINALLGKHVLSGNRWQWLGLEENEKGMYATQISGEYLFHSVPYTQWYDHGSLLPGEFDKLGQTVSQPGIRLQVKDAKWIYDHMGEIEGVEFYNSPDPGPLGKPSAPKIDGSAHPGWDPTDPDENNPWLAPPEPDPDPVFPPEPEQPLKPEPPRPLPPDPEATPDPVPPTTAE